MNLRKIWEREMVLGRGKGKVEGNGKDKGEVRRKVEGIERERERSIFSMEFPRLANNVIIFSFKIMAATAPRYSSTAN